MNVKELREKLSVKKKSFNDPLEQAHSADEWARVSEVSGCLPDIFSREVIKLA